MKGKKIVFLYSFAVSLASLITIIKILINIYFYDFLILSEPNTTILMIEIIFGSIGIISLSYTFYYMLMEEIKNG